MADDAKRQFARWSAFLKRWVPLTKTEIEDAEVEIVDGRVTTWASREVEKRIEDAFQKPK